MRLDGLLYLCNKYKNLLQLQFTLMSDKKLQRNHRKTSGRNLITISNSQQMDDSSRFQVVRKA
ncbi:CLUMA_CG003927, isoform A [Clunio marinus]|uniref:CLUMA_CG003927, isoform A n=1 Tax=Clunio marinus TaxID=568069 RepID=A0A1J1HQ93_9DIPT|nr:CLUMA_CG003927, isoform A [Clunio marinus]